MFEPFKMAVFLRRRVSQNRRRFVSDKYDLDLTYITDNIIAMGYPSDRVIQSLIRNPIESVSKYLSENHANSYKIFNLCQESDYSHIYFDNMVEIIPIEDHHPPKFSQIEPFCKSVSEWLSKHDDNVAIIHCKAGKGRTGTMISNYFIYSREFTDPFAAMNYFNIQRCKDNKGVTIPSQRRCIESFADYIQNSRQYESVKILLKSIEIKIPEESKQFPNSLRLCIFNDIDRKAYDSELEKKKKQSNKFLFDLNEANLVLSDDVKVVFLTKKSASFMEVSFNTFTVVQDNPYATHELSCLGRISYKPDDVIEWSLKKKDIDRAHKNKLIEPNLTITFEFKILQELTPKLIMARILTIPVEEIQRDPGVETKSPEIAQ